MNIELLNLNDQKSESMKKLSAKVYKKSHKEDNTTEVKKMSSQITEAVKFIKIVRERSKDEN
jgi:hypothetical protein